MADDTKLCFRLQGETRSIFFSEKKLSFIAANDTLAKDRRETEKASSASRKRTEFGSGRGDKSEIDTRGSQGRAGWNVQNKAETKKLTSILTAQLSNISGQK